MRGFAQLLCIASVVVGGLLNACSAQEGVLLHVELTRDPSLPKIDHLQLYVGRQVNPGSSFPEFAPGRPTFEREVGDDEFVLSEYNVDVAFDLMLPSGSLPLWPEWRQVLIVGSVKNPVDGSLTPVAWGASKVGGTAGRVNRYDISLRAVDNKFVTAPGCVAWNAGLVIELGAQCPGAVCVPQDPLPSFVDTVCDGIDADCNSEPAVVDAGSCMRAYPTMNGGQLCNLIDRATCNEIEAMDEGYLCERLSIPETTCLSLGHCDGAEATGLYPTLLALHEPVERLLKKIDVKCGIPVDERGVPCGEPAKTLKLSFGNSDTICAAQLGDRYVDPRYATIGNWVVQATARAPIANCEGNFKLTSAQGGELMQGAVLLGAQRMDQLKVGITVEIKPVQATVAVGGGCMNPLVLSSCTIESLPTGCLQ